MEFFDTKTEALFDEINFWRDEIGTGREVYIEIHRYGEKYSGTALPHSDEIVEVGNYTT